VILATTPQSSRFDGGYMLGQWFKKRKLSSSAKDRADAPAASAGHPASLNQADQALAVQFLCRKDSVMPLSPKEAAQVARYMLPRQFKPGEVLIREGDTHSNYMLWILRGDATIEAVTARLQDPLTMTVLQPGNTLGEMGLMDGSRRSVTCTASSSVRAAILTRQSLRTLSSKHPEVAVKLMSLVCMGISVRLRDVTDKFKRYVVMTHAMRDELLHAPDPEAAVK
jgi:CRP/FNR family transcriptional regulator, cyclic AMP receptor protein